jgi:predicted esterase
MRPGLTTAIAGLFGFMPEADGRVFASRPLLGVKVWSAYGESDPYIPLEAALGAVDRLASAGAAVESHAYPGGHKLPRSGLRDLAAWWRTL